MFQKILFVWDSWLSLVILILFRERKRTNPEHNHIGQTHSTEHNHTGKEGRFFMENKLVFEVIGEDSF